MFRHRITQPLAISYLIFGAVERNEKITRNYTPRSSVPHQSGFKARPAEEEVEEGPDGSLAAAVKFIRNSRIFNRSGYRVARIFQKIFFLRARYIVMEKFTRTV